MNPVTPARRNRAGFLLLAASAGLLFASCAANRTGSSGEPRESRARRDARMAWWRDAKFGLFIHWGLYAVPAGRWNGERIGGIGEWLMHHARIPVGEYAALAGSFNPTGYDADAWVRLAKAAGMKYVIITSKHHDGFAMFHSAASAFNIVDATPFNRDPLAELAEACRTHGLKLGFYYSQAQDWHHPGGAAAGGHWDPAQDGDMDEYLRRIAAPQVREILSNYGPVAVLWWDTPVGMTRSRADLLRPLLDLQPGIITNNRLGGGYAGDTDTPEQHIPATGIAGRDWETCMTMNGTWGYKRDDENWKSVDALLRNLVDIVSKGGNYLLNVGPTAGGTIPEPSVVRLRAIGRWLDANGEAIYGSRPSPFRRLPWGRCTSKRGRLYLHVFDWPEDGLLRVPGLRNRTGGARLLAAPARNVAVVRHGEDYVLDVGRPAPDPAVSVIELRIDGAPDVDNAVRPRDDGSVLLRARDAEIRGRAARYEAGGGKDNIGYWTDAADRVAWPFRVPNPGPYRVAVEYACEPAAAGSRYVVEVGDQRVVGSVAATGEWTDFVSVTVGTIVLDEAGRHELTVAPESMPGYAVMNLKSVTLTPAFADHRP